jgi:hypothetical protein
MANPIRPEDVLPDGVESRSFAGTAVRKGSVAAFVANAALLGQLAEGSAEYRVVADQLRALAPALEAVGVLEVFAPRSERIARILEDALGGVTHSGTG